MSGGVFPPMPTLRASINVSQSISIVLALEFQGKIWIVHEWLHYDPPGLVRPKRIIRIDNLPSYQDTRGIPHRPTEFSVGSPIPISVLDGTALAAEATGYEVVEQPPLRFQVPPAPTLH
jgi:hypothetical protein